MEYSDGSTRYIDFAKGYIQHDEVKKRQESKNKLHTIYVALPMSLYEIIKDVGRKEMIGFSRVIIDAVNDYLSNMDSSEDCSVKFKKLQQIHHLKINNTRRVGLGVKHEEYLRIKSFSEQNNTSMSEVIRSIVDYKFRDTSDAVITEQFSDDSVLVKPQDDEFKMYIDLS